jgi:transposase
MGSASCNDPTHAKLLDQVAQLTARLDAMAEKSDERDAEHAREIAELKSKLGRDSSNSSRPPSQDGLGQKQTRRKERQGSREPSGRKQGAQPGHPGHRREFVDESEVDHIEVHFPPTCEGCGHDLPEILEGDPRREQKWEIPPVKPVVTEHRFHTVTCPCCGEQTTAKPGPAIPPGAFGPRVEAIVAYLRGSAHLSVSDVQRVFADLFGLDLSRGVVPRICERVSERLGAAHQEALLAVRSADVVHADETPWYLRGALAWLWLAATETLKVFRVDESRTTAAARRLLGETLLGVLVTDRYTAYRDHPAERHQFCIPHLIRDAKGLIALGGEAEHFGERLKALLKNCCWEWRRFKREHNERELMREQLRPTLDSFIDLLVEGIDGGHARVATFCAHLLKKCESVFTFLDYDCPPSNNLSEQSLRKPVLWRKICLGSQSKTGFRFVERILTAVESLRAQGRDILGFLVETMSAAAQGRAPPSLLPVAAN